MKPVKQFTSGQRVEAIRTIGCLDEPNDIIEQGEVGEIEICEGEVRLHTKTDYYIIFNEDMGDITPSFGPAPLDDREILKKIKDILSHCDSRAAIEAINDLLKDID